MLSKLYLKFDIYCLRSSFEVTDEKHNKYSVQALQKEVQSEHAKMKEFEMQQGPKASYGYGGKFGVEKDRMDSSAMSHDHKEALSKHSSQVDAAKGFGGKYGVEKDRIDKVRKTYCINNLLIFLYLNYKVC